jgi:glutamate:GABA antiporter
MVSRTQVNDPQLLEQTTAVAVEEKAKLRKNFRRFDMLLFTVCALVGLDTLGAVSKRGPVAFFWLVVLAVVFLLPYALLMAEIGSAFTLEGGPYEWMKLAWGRLAGSLGAMLYWVTNPIWVGGSLVLTATAAFQTNFANLNRGQINLWAGHPIYVAAIVFGLAFIWGSIIVAIVSLDKGKWIPNFGAIGRFVVLGLFSFTVVLYAIKHGLHSAPHLGAYNPFGGGWSLGITAALGIVPIILFNYVGFELQNGAAEEMVNAQRDVPVTVIRSGLIAVVAYVIPIFGIILVLPSSQVSGLSGFMDSVGQVFSVYGSAQKALVQIATALFILALMTSGAVWMIGSDRVAAIAAADGGAPKYFAGFSARFGTPVRVNVTSGIVATIFFLAATVIFTGGKSAQLFLVVLYLATSTTLLSYLLIFPAVWKLRVSHAHVHRPYHFPGGDTALKVAVAIVTFFMVIGSWVALFPGTLENWLGGSYVWTDNWSISRTEFETFTLGTLAVFMVVALVGYAMGADTRRASLSLNLDTDPPVYAPMDADPSALAGD